MCCVCGNAVVVPPGCDPEDVGIWTCNRGHAYDDEHATSTEGGQDECCPVCSMQAVSIDDLYVALEVTAGITRDVLAERLLRKFGGDGGGYPFLEAWLKEQRRELAKRHSSQ